MEIGDCQDEVILGMDFLKKHVTAMDFGRPSVTIGSETIELTFFRPEPGPVRVIAGGDVVVPDMTERH